jgi:hypothetical protein
VAIRIRLGDSADVDSAVAVYERSNLARRQGVWPNRASRQRAEPRAARVSGSARFEAVAFAGGGSNNELTDRPEIFSNRARRHHAERG